MSLSHVIGITLAFGLGFIAMALVQNIFGAENVSFSTTSLVSFLFGIALSAASTVLAITAIALGRASEEAMIERSDESIRLQNEVFTRTSEALASIQASTGVTEKRIEDIISGRAGDISHRIAEVVAEDAGGRGRSRQKLEEEIRASLLEEISEERRKEDRRRRATRESEEAEARRKYLQFKDDFLLRLANMDGVTVEKLGDGHVGGKGDDLADAVFRVDSHRLGVFTFSASDALSRSFARSFDEFLNNLAAEMSRGTFDRALVAFDSKVSPESMYGSALRELNAIARPDIAESIEVIDDNTQTSLEAYVTSLMESQAEQS